MTCEEAREALSALLDDEEPGRPAEAVNAHLLDCSACLVWQEEAATLSRRLRLSLAPPVPDLTGAVLAAIEVDRRARMWRDLPATRVALVLIAVAQVVLAAPVVLGHDHEAPVHVARELGSFQLALAVGFITAALRPHRAAGLAPLTGAVAVLLLLTGALDLGHHHTDVLDELPHLLAVGGSLLLWRIGSGSDGHGRTWQMAIRGANKLASRRRRRRPEKCPDAGRRLARLAVALGIVTVSAVLGAVPANAHATLSSSTPAAGTVLTTVPEEVLLNFDEPVTTLEGAVRVLDASGRRVDQGTIRHPGGDGSEVAVDLAPGLIRGTYLVDWRVVSADSHPVSGSFTFSVGAAGAVASVSADNNGPAVGLLLGMSRLVTFAGLVLLLGGSIFLVLCWADGLRSATVQRLLWSGWGAGVIGTAGGLLLEGPYAADEPLSQATFGRLLAAVATTPYGHALLWRLAVLLAAGRLLFAVTRGGARGRWVLFAGGGLGAAYAFSVALAGHAGAGTERGLALLADSMHLTAMSAWLGGLAFLSVALMRTSRLDHLAVAVPRFSRLAFTSVVLLVVTGGYQAWREVGSFDAALATPYGRLLLVKLGFVLLLVGLGAVSRSWVRRLYPLPVVHAWVDTPTTESESQNQTPSPVDQLRSFRRSVLGEIAVALVVLAITAALVAAEPARSAYRPATATTVQAGPVQVQLSVSPTGPRQLEVHAYLFGRDGAPLAVPEMTADLSLAAQDLGPLNVPLLDAGPGHYIAETVSVPIAGEWTLEVHVRTTDVTEYSTTIPLTVR
jgi:copper transport protein